MNSWPTDEPSRQPGPRDEASADVRGYMSAIGRSKGVIALIVLLGVAVVLVLSLVLPKNYKATTEISLDPQGTALGTADAESTQRELATLETLTTSTEVLDAAAAELGEGETADSLEDKVSSSVDENANIINVVGEDGDADRAAEISNAVANSFLEVQANQEKQRLERAQVDLQAQIDRLQASGTDSSAQVSAIQSRLSQIAVEIQLAGSNLQIAQPADVPNSPSSPRPVRNTLLAFFGFLFIGILVALGRDQLRPRLRSGRELSRLAGGLPILATIPHTSRGRFARRRGFVAEHEAYQTLRAEVRAAVPADRHEVILITSALHAEGKSTVTVRLGKALAQAGHSVLLVSGDLRAPAVHWQFDVPGKPGVSEAIEAIDGGTRARDAVRDVVRPAAPDDGKGNRLYRLDLIPSGDVPNDPSKLLASKGADEFFDQVRSLGYDYVLVDSTPLLGLADTQALAAHADEILLVGKLDRVSAENVIDAQEILARLDVHRIGVVVIGGQVERSSYHYYARR